MNLEFLPVGLELDGAQVRVSVWDGQKPSHIAGVSALPALIGVVDHHLVWATEAQKLQLESPASVLTLEECLADNVLRDGDVIYTGKRLLHAYWATLLLALEQRLEVPCSLSCIAVTGALTYPQRLLLMESIGESCRSGSPRVVDSAVTTTYQYAFTMRRDGARYLLCSLATDGASLSLVSMDEDVMEILTTLELPELDLQSIQAELADLCLTLSRKPRYLLPRLQQQLRYQFGAFQAVDTINLFLDDRPVELSRRDVLECVEKRLHLMQNAIEQLCQEADVPFEALHGVLLCGALAELPGVEEVLLPVFDRRPIVLEGTHRAADGACLIAAILAGALPCEPLLLDVAGTDYHLLEVSTGRIVATIRRWDTIPCGCDLITGSNLSPRQNYQLVQAVGTKLIPIPGGAFKANARRYKLTVDPFHKIQIESSIR